MSRRQSVMKRLGLRAVALLVFSGLIATAMTLYAFGLLFQVFRSGDQRSYDYVLRGVSLSVYALPLFLPVPVCVSWGLDLFIESVLKSSCCLCPLLPLFLFERASQLGL